MINLQPRLNWNLLIDPRVHFQTLILLVCFAFCSCQPSTDNSHKGGAIDNGGAPQEEFGGGARGALTEGEAALSIPAGGDAGTSEEYDGILKPVGFVNHGIRDAAVRAWTWIPAGATEPKEPPIASTVSTASTSPGLWPNPSRFISVPLGTYTWCIDWEEGDLDQDGKFDYFHYIDDRLFTLSETDPDDLDLARQVDISAPAMIGDVFDGKCADHPKESACTTGGVETGIHSEYALEANNPPETYANANTAEYPSPPGIKVSFGAGTTAWGINRIMWTAGDWIEATTGDPYSAIGIQVHGDQTIGWARVLFDNVEIWRGDTSASTIADGRYGVYVEARCFSPGQHTIRLEALGMDGSGGGRSVPVSYIGFRD